MRAYEMLFAAYQQHLHLFAASKQYVRMCSASSGKFTRQDSIQNCLSKLFERENVGKKKQKHRQRNKNEEK